MSVLKPHIDVDPRTNRAHDLRLDLCTPQMNRLRYLIGMELYRIVPSDSVPEYIMGAAEDDTPPSEYVHIKDGYKIMEDRTYPLDAILRTTDQDEVNYLTDLKRRLDNLWFTSDQERESNADDAPKRDTVEINRGDLVTLVQYAMNTAGEMRDKHAGDMGHGEWDDCTLVDDFARELNLVEDD